MNLGSCKRIVIAGTGLLGASLGLALREAGLTMDRVGVGRTPATLELARSVGAVDRVSQDLCGAAGDADLVILCTPVRTIERQLEQLGRLDRPELVISDVGSTKSGLQRAADQYLRDPRQFVGAHPMAGSEQHGPMHARSDLYRSRLCLLCPGPASHPEAVSLVRQLWERIGMRIQICLPADHDRLVAWASHMPHAVAAMIVDQVARADALGVAAGGFADMSRLAGGEPGLWTDIFLENASAIAGALRSSARGLEQMADWIDHRQAEPIQAFLTRTAQLRRHWQEQRSES